MHKNVADEIRIFNEYCKIVSIDLNETLTSIKYLLICEHFPIFKYINMKLKLYMCLTPLKVHACKMTDRNSAVRENLVSPLLYYITCMV